MKYRYLSIFLILLILSVGAVSAQEDAASDDGVSIAQDNGVLSSAEIVIDDSNYNDYFDNASGMILETSNISGGDTIKLGNISNKDFVFDRLLIITSNSSSDVLTNVTINFVEGSDNSTVSDLNIANGEKTAIVVFEVSNIEISNNVIKVADGDGLYELYAIYAVYANNLRVDTNTITYTGKTNGTASNAVIYVSESEGVEILSNDIDASLISCPIDWKAISAYEYIPNCISQAVYFNECPDVEFILNDIYVEYSNFTGSSDTIYVVNFYDCDNADIEKNTIEGIGHTYIYGLVIRGDNFRVYDNGINMVSDENYTNGINIEGESTGEVVLNRIFLESPYVAYGIYSAWNWAGDSPTVNYTYNYIGAESHAVYAMNLYGSESIIEGNVIKIHGNYTMGISSMMMDDLAIIEGNDITVNGLKNDSVDVGDMVPAQTVGILAMSESKITNNIIKSAGNWTIVNSGYDVEITDNYLVSSELLGDDSVDDRSDEAVVENNIPIANATNYDLTNSTFSLFFDDNGLLRDNITAESLTFHGEFSNLIVDQIAIGRPMTLLSDDATIYNLPVLISSSNVVIDGFNFIVDDVNGQIGIIYSNNVSIINSKFTMNGDEEIDNTVIYVIESNNVTIENNEINFAVETNDTYENVAIYAEECENLNIIENRMSVLLPARSINWSTGTVYSQAVFLKDCDDAVLEDNYIEARSNGQISKYDTLYAVHIVGDNANVNNNIIWIEDAPYGYGLVISGGDFLIEENTIIIDRGGAYSCGIDVEGESDGVVNGNNIGVISSDVAYGIYACDWNMEGQAIDYTNNDIVGEAPSVYGMELLFGEESLISGNKISLDGNYTIGIAEMMMYDAATIINNQIHVFGTNNDMVKGGDMVPAVTVGIFSMGESKINNNVITSTGNWTVINSGYDSVITDNYLVSNELLGDDSVNDTLGEAVVENNIPIVNATNYNVTNDTFFLFFNDGGNLRENVTAESLTFIGEFSDLTLWNEISKPIKLISDNATLYDMSFVISSDNVTFDGFTFISDGLSQLITIEGDNVQIINNQFMFEGAEDDNNYVIYITDSDNVLIYNNRIISGVETNDTYFNNVIFAEDSDDLIVYNNFIAASLPARPIDWTSGDIYSQGVFLNDCDDAVLFGNYIGIYSNDQISVYDTVYAVHIVGDNATVIRNQIGVIEAPYGYALVISGEDFNITGNMIVAGENGTYACGIEVDGPSNGVIDTNLIYVTGESAYGIYTANWNGNVKTDIINNTVLVDGVTAFGMSLSGSEASVENNTIGADGNFTTGIAAAVDMIFITNNTIMANGSDVGIPLGYDMMGIETIGIHTVSGDALVKYNNITSNGVFAVEIEGTGAVTDNELYAKVLTGDLAVDYIQDSGVLVVNNTPEMELDYILTNDTFYAYFDKQGMLREEIKSDNLTFVGEFSNLVTEINIDVPIALLSDGAVLNDMGINICSDNVTVIGFNFTGENAGFGVYDSDNVVIRNNKVVIKNPTFDSNVCIEIIDSDNVILYKNVFGLMIGDNNGTYANNIIYAENSNDLYIISNDMAAYLPPRDVNWTSGEVYSEGVSLEDCDNAILFNNRIVVMANNDTTSEYATIYALHITGDNATIFKNQIGVLEAPYGYALVIQGNNFNITENMIAAGENGSYACAIEVDGPSNGVIDNNQMETRGVSSYGIYTANWNGDIKVNITGNTVVSSGNTVFGLSLTGSEVLVENNSITTKGNFTTAIASSVASIDINNNEIVAKGTGIGTPLGYDNMGINNAAFNLNGNSSGYIYSNNITANGNGFIITGESPEIECNTINVVDTGLSDSYVIYASESCVAVHDNSISYVGNTNGTYDNAVISASESDMLIFNNEINANLVSCPIDWVETPPASFNYVPYCISQAIYFNECSAVDLSGNSIFVEYTNATASADTIYIVNVYGCDDAVIEGNNINGFGHTYIYGIVVRGENFTVDRNEINLESDEKYVCGIDIEGESTGIVIENTIYLESPYVAYGIYSAWNWAGDSPTVDYLANYIEAESHAVYAMNIYGSEGLIDGNIIIANGDYTMGICSMMMDDVAVITNNDITVNGLKNDTEDVGDMVPVQTVGILAMSESQIHNNAITSTGNWTIINTAEDSEITDNYLVSSELMGDDSVDDRSGEAVVENNIPVADATNYNLTNDTFFLFFNEEGRLRDNITAESLTFIGEFSDLTLWNVIDRPIKLLSDNATLYDMSFTITSDNVTVDGFTFVADNSISNVIFIEESDNVSIVNCIFDVVGVEDDDNVVISLFESDNVSIDNNIIKLEVETNETYKNFALYAADSDNLNISGNTIAALLPARSINWITGDVYSQGVFLNDCDNAVLTNNTVAVKSNGQISEYDTIYALHIVGDDATVIGNTIGVLEAPYGYALVIEGSDFNITRNWVGAGENASYACAIDVEGPSNGVIDTNEICAMGESGYGVYTADWAGDVKADIINNVIYVNAISGFGMSLSGSEVLVENNKVLVNGNFTTGIASAVENIIINNNTIIANGSDVGTPAGYDMMGIETIGVHIVAGEAIVTNNNITSNGVFAVEDRGTGKVTDNEIYAKVLTGDLAVDYIQDSGVIVADNIPEMELDYILTNDTFYAYFDKQGRLRGEIKNDNLTFVGEFSNLVECIYIDEPVKLLSDGAVLNDMAIAILSDNVTVDGFNFTGQVSAIYVDDSDNVKILNTVINITDSTFESNVCIEIHNSNNVLVDNCVLLLSIEPQNGTYSNEVIFAEDSDDLIISNNEIVASLPARPINWTSGDIYSQGVFLDDCDGAVLFNNTIGVKANDQMSTYDTVYAVHIVGDNATVVGNQLGVLEAPYGYALVISGEDFNITGNMIFAGENGTYACAIEVDGPSNGVIDTNLIYAIADESAYGIYTANWAGDMKADIVNNYVYADANSPFAMSLSGSESLVENNSILVEGNFTTGIASAVENITINNNTIEAMGSNVGIPLGYDMMGIETTGIHIVRGEAIVTENNVTTTGDYAVDDKGTGNVNENYLVANEFTGDAAVDYDAEKVIVANNVPTMYTAVLTAEDIVMYFRNGTSYVVKLTDKRGNVLTNQTVVIKINGVRYTRVTDAEGTASIGIGLGSGIYPVTTYYTGVDFYTNATVESNITVLTTAFGDDLVKVFKNDSQYTATFVDGQGNPLVNTDVKFNVNGIMYTRKTNENGTAQLDINLPQGKYIITAINTVTGEMHANNITVLPRIVENNDITKYFKNGTQYTVKLIGDDGNPVGAGEEVTFNINGIFYKRTTDENGTAQLDINLPPSDYIITAEYKGCKVSNKIKVLPVLSAEDLTKKYGGPEQFITTLVDGQGKPYEGQTVTFNINGRFYDRTTDSNGQAKLDINLLAGEYIITSSYNGANIANKVTVTA